MNWINVALSFGLYGDFTQPADRGLDLSIWNFLTIAGRRLTPPRFHDDPVWTLLAQLAGDCADQNQPAPWMRWLIPCIRARLARGVHRAGRRQAGALLCVHRATVLTSATHVDVMFSLADLPIAIRLSGLDRDPGWIPAADRVIAFHYD